jgi:hypothetical protein
MTPINFSYSMASTLLSGVTKLTGGRRASPGLLGSANPVEKRALAGPEEFAAQDAKDSYVRYISSLIRSHAFFLL